jgi:hypothetical protein
MEEEGECPYRIIHMEVRLKAGEEEGRVARLLSSSKTCNMDEHIII